MPLRTVPLPVASSEVKLESWYEMKQAVDAPFCCCCRRHRAGECIR
jgi:hypothetical protein